MNTSQPVKTNVWHPNTGHYILYLGVFWHIPQRYCA